MSSANQSHAFVLPPESVVDMFWTTSDWLDGRGIPPIIVIAAALLAMVQLIIIAVLVVRCFIQMRYQTAYDDYEKLGADNFLANQAETPGKSLARHGLRSTSEPCLSLEASVVLSNPPTPSVRRFTLQPGASAPGRRPRRSPAISKRGVSLKEDQSSGAAEKRVQFSVRPSQSAPRELFRGSMDGSDQGAVGGYSGTGTEGTAPAQGGAAASMSPPSQCGMILFTVTYDRVSEQVKVYVDRARQLRLKAPERVADTFVKVALTPEREIPPAVSRVFPKSADPVYRHTSLFRVAPDVMKELVVKIQVYELDRFSQNDPVGELEYPLSQLRTLDTGDLLWRDLQPLPGKVVDITKGEVLFSLTYLPNAEKVNIIVLKARNLKTPGLRKQSASKDGLDTFVKVTLVKSGKVMKFKQTRICRKSNQPVYNEGFSLKVRRADLDEVSVTLAVCVRLNHLGFHRVIGRCIVGRHVGGKGTSHWQDMISAPRSGLGQWHSLL